MENKNEFKKFNIKNCTCYYFNDIMEVENINIDRILLDKKSFKKIIRKYFNL